jgi:hypothetical protein
MKAAPVLIDAPVAPPSKPKGLSTPKTWRAVLAGSTGQEQAISLIAVLRAIVKGELPISLVKIDQTALNQWARSTKGTQTPAGLRVFEAADQVRYR